MVRKSAARSAVSIALSVLVGASACGRGEPLGVEEAVEILVLDGVERRRAECVVNDLDGELELEKITGLDTDLDDDDLAVLGAASASCAPVVADGGGVTGGEDDIEDLLWSGELLDIDEVVAGLVRGGLDPDIGACLGEAITASPDPQSAATDDRFLADALLSCELGV